LSEVKPLTNYDVLVKLTEHHLCEIYGPYGVGKSRLMHHIALEAQLAGKRVLYIDTEGGLTDEHARQLQNYWYVGDEIDALEEAVQWAVEHRNDYDLLIVDSVGHVVYASYVELGKMDEKLKAFQRLAAIFRDMVRFARGVRGVDFNPKNPFECKRKALSLATNHPISEFARVAKDLPPEEPLAPMGGQIHRVPKVILRIEPVEQTPEKSTFNLLTYKLRDWPKNVAIGIFTIDANGVWVEWCPEITGIPKPALPPPTPTPAPAPVQPRKLTVEDVRKALPPELMDYLRVEEAADHIKITPRQYLGSENFAKIMESIKPIGGFYVSLGRESHFRVPKG
jgi:hypothetical protein